jgi:tRNA (Thr-GGU) A37 N-methylase
MSIQTNSRQHAQKAAVRPMAAFVLAVANHAPHGSFASITNAPNRPNQISRNYAAILAVRQQATSVHAPEATVKPA